MIVNDPVARRAERGVTLTMVKRAMKEGYVSRRWWRNHGLLA